MLTLMMNFPPKLHLYKTSSNTIINDLAFYLVATQAVDTQGFFQQIERKNVCELFAKLTTFFVS